MPTEEEPRVFEIRIDGCASLKEALALQEPIARILCPDESHEPPCAVPWSFTLADEQANDDWAETDNVVLVLGVYTSSRKVSDVAERVRTVAGQTGSVVWSEGDPDRFEELVEQYRIENEPRQT